MNPFNPLNPWSGKGAENPTEGRHHNPTEGRLGNPTEGRPEKGLKRATNNRAGKPQKSTIFNKQFYNSLFKQNINNGKSYQVFD